MCRPIDPSLYLHRFSDQLLGGECTSKERQQVLGFSIAGPCHVCTQATDRNAAGHELPRALVQNKHQHLRPSPGMWAILHWLSTSLNLPEAFSSVLRMVGQPQHQHGLAAHSLLLL